MIVLAGPASFELEVKRSRFLARAHPLESPDAAEPLIERLRCADASHNCWAWRVGAQYRSHDDGEPGGTAGRPILAAIDGAGLDRVLVLVARWFGGIKLGAGGLVRAYGGAAAECLRLAPRCEVRPRARLRVRGAFAHIGLVHRLLRGFEVSLLAERHEAEGVSWEVELEAARVPEFVAALEDGARGRIEVLDGL